jgi:hypothetical protein
MCFKILGAWSNKAGRYNRIGGEMYFPRLKGSNDKPIRRKKV